MDTDLADEGKDGSVPPQLSGLPKVTSAKDGKAASASSPDVNQRRRSRRFLESTRRSLPALFAALFPSENVVENKLADCFRSELAAARAEFVSLAR